MGREREGICARHKDGVRNETGMEIFQAERSDCAKLRGRFGDLSMECLECRMQGAKEWLGMRREVVCSVDFHL